MRMVVWMKNGKLQLFVLDMYLTPQSSKPPPVLPMLESSENRERLNILQVFLSKSYKRQNSSRKKSKKVQKKSKKFSKEETVIKSRNDRLYKQTK